MNLSALRIPALGVVLFAGLMSLSRGGAVAAFVAAAIAMAVCYRAGAVGKRFVLGAAAAAALIAASLLIHGYQQVSDRLGQLGSGSLEQLDHGRGRRTIWAAVLAAVPDYWLLGSGIGSHRDVYPMYTDASLEVEFTHAENSPLQVVLEAGVAGAALVLAGVGLCAYWCIRGLRATGSSRPVREGTGGRAARATRKLGLDGPQDGRSLGPTGRQGAPRRIPLCAGAVAASLAANVVHAMVDFVWYVPACMAFVVLLAGCAFRLQQFAARPARKQALYLWIPRHVAITVTLLVAAAGTWMIAASVGPAFAEPHWDRYQILQSADACAAEGNAQPAGSPSSPQHDETRLARTNHMIAELEEVVRWDPDHARAHVRLARLYLRRFDLRQRASEIAMPLEQLCDAAMTGGFSSREAVARWLSRVAGERGEDLDRAREQAVQALRLGPLQGDGYLCLAQLCCFDGPGSAAAKQACIAQALAVRPHDGAVLFEAGREASLAGNLPQAIDYWRQSARSGPSHQRRLIEFLGGRVPVGFFLESLEPDLAGLRLLHAQYSQLEQPGQWERLCFLYRQFAHPTEADRTEEAATVHAWLYGQLRELREHHVRAAEDAARRLQGVAAAPAWLEVAAIYHELEEPAAEFGSAEHALRCDPSSLPARQCLAQCLVAAGHFDEAEQHLSWCLRRQPYNRDLQQRLSEVVKKRIDRRDRTAAGLPARPFQ